MKTKQPPALERKRLVWDLPVRLFHWALVILILTQWLTAEVFEGYNELHSQLGYVTLGLIIFRFLWGFVGPTYARFSNFIRPPGAILHYIKDQLNTKHQHHIGHNPLGGLMLPAVLLVVGLQAISGLFISDEIFHSGPYFQSLGEQNTQRMEWLHHNMFDILLLLIGIHLVAVGWYQLKLKKDLFRPMLDGKKVIRKDQAINSSQLLRAIILIILVAIFIYWLVVIAPPEVDIDYYF